MQKPICDFYAAKISKIALRQCKNFKKMHHDRAFLPLMRLPQQIINRFYWVERQNRDFDEDGDPVRHGTVPEAWELHGFQVFAVFRLHRDEAGFWVDVIREVERIALEILGGADQIDGVEVG